MSILDKEMSHKLQLMADLTLTQNIQTARQSEEAALQVHQQGEAYASVQEIRGKVADRGKPKRQPKKKESGGQEDSKCGCKCKKGVPGKGNITVK